MVDDLVDTARTIVDELGDRADVLAAIAALNDDQFLALTALVYKHAPGAMDADAEQWRDVAVASLRYQQRNAGV